MPFCSQCGGQVSNTAHFCIHCGTALDGSSPPQPGKDAQEVGKPSGRRILKLGAIGCGGLLGLIVLVALIGALFGPDSEEGSPVSTAPSTRVIPFPTSTSLPVSGAPSTRVIPRPTSTSLAASTLIGQWQDIRGSYWNSCITLTDEEGKIYLAWKFEDGSSLVEKVIEKESDLGRRFDPAERSPTGDHFIIDNAGNLLLADNTGPINTARKSSCS